MVHRRIRGYQRALQFAAVASLVLGLAGCGNPTGTNHPTPSGSVTATTPMTGTLTPGAAPTTTVNTIITPTMGTALAATFTLKIGASSNLLHPRDVAVDASGNIFVTDADNKRIVEFDSAGKQLRVIGGPGTGNGQFQSPWIVDINAQGNIVVLDRATSWISTFDAAGKFISRMAGPTAGLYFPGGMAINHAGNILIADTGGNRVLTLGGNGKITGTPITKAGDEPLSQPADVSVDAAGGLHVYEPSLPASYNRGQAGELINFDATGKFTSEWSGPIETTADTPRSISAADGRIFLSDPQQGRILVYSADGASMQPLKITGLGFNGANSPFKLLGGIALDKQGHLYAVDVNSNVIYRIQVSA